MAHTACIVCFISTVNGCSKKKKENALKDVVLVAGTQQNSSNLYSLDIYGLHAGAVSLPPADVIFAQLSCPLNDVIFC
jgi:hypothetical protein